MFFMRTSERWRGSCGIKMISIDQNTDCYLSTWMIMIILMINLMITPHYNHLSQINIHLQK